MTSDREIDAEIRSQIAQQAELQQGFRTFLNEVVQTWRGYSPVRTGRYSASVQVLKRFTSEGMPGATVGSNSNRAHLIEYGTGQDTQAKKGELKNPRYVPALGVQLSTDTPTPAFAPRALTATHFGGDEQPVRDIMEADMGRDERKAALKPFGATIAYTPGEG